MRCTNRKRILPALLISTILLSGCGSQAYDLPYNPDTTVTGFQVTDATAATHADGFAKELCVTAKDIMENTTVDMSEASAAGLFDLNNKEVVYAKNVHEKLYPASLTKVMTALVALKYGNPNDMITVGPNVKITESGAQLCGLTDGDQLTLDQALHALLMDSANDAGVAIAEHIGGSIDGFAEMMNQEALDIGATNSHFVNPHGLQDDNHYTTVYDMYLIFNEAMKYSLFTETIHMNAYETTYTDKNGDNKTLKFNTTNQYLNGSQKTPENITVIGGKTGTTNAAGNCLIILSKDTSGNPYISIILRSKERQILYQEMTGLLEEITK